jgi:ABC-type transport system involved in multi-copper enzyme maturation permease subunit
MTQFFAVVVLVPALTAPVIAAERANDTLGLLMMTNLGSAHLLFDKLLSRIALMALLLLSGLPVMMVFLAFGGVTPWQIGMSYVTIFATMLFCCGAGLYVSTVSSRMTSALVGTYAVLIGYVGGIVLIGMFVGFLWNSRDAVNALLSFLPISIIFGADESDFVFNTITFLAISIFVFVISIIKCTILLPRIGASPTTSVLKRQFGRMNRFFRRINFTGVTVMRERIPLNGDAFVWKETQMRFCCSNIFLLRTSYILVGICMIVALPWGSDATGAMILSCIHLSILAIFTVIQSATAFTMEKEKHVLDILMSTSVTGRSVVLAKFLGVLKSVSVFLLVPPAMMMLNFIPALAGSNWHWFRGLMLLGAEIAGFLPIIIIIGFFFSLVCRRSATAIAATFFTVLAWIFVPLVTGVMWKEDIMLGRGSINVDKSDLDVQICDFLIHLSPAGSLDHVFYGNEQMMLAGIVLPAIGIWILMLVMLIRRFDRLVGRG